MRGVAEPIVDAYEHDAIDQLVRARCQVVNGVPARDVQYRYDLVGNRQVVTEDGVAVQYTVNNLNGGEEPLEGRLLRRPLFRVGVEPTSRVPSMGMG